MATSEKSSNEPSFWGKVERELNKVAAKLDDVFTSEDNKNKEGMHYYYYEMPLYDEDFQFHIWKLNEK